MPLAELSVVDGRYRLERRLGQGGMGVVYEARHLTTGRRVAVKIIPSDSARETADAIARFQREARAAGTIESRHVARVIDTGVDPPTGDSYLAMDLLQGEDLQALLERLAPLPPELALRIASQACLGLQKAHEAGVVHRDIKPSNLFLARQDGGEIVVTLLDFGIAKIGVDRLSTAGEVALTRTGALVGSPLYMSPEQAKGSRQIDHRTDIWSLGVVLYEALCGTPPNSTTDSLGSLIFAICSQVPPPLQERAPWISIEIASVVHRALALDPSGRFATAAEMGAALRALLPSGHGVDEASLRPLDPTLRALAPARLIVRPPSVPDAGGLQDVSVYAPTVSGTSTDATKPRPRSRLAPVLLSIAGASALSVGLTAAVLHHAGHVSTQGTHAAPAPLPTPLVVSSPSTPQLAPPLPAPSSVPSTLPASSSSAPPPGRGPRPRLPTTPPKPPPQPQVAPEQPKPTTAGGDVDRDFH